jgi:hypothetical protein
MFKIKKLSKTVVAAMLISLGGLSVTAFATSNNVADAGVRGKKVVNHLEGYVVPIVISELKAAGYDFSSISDGELILDSLQFDELNKNLKNTAYLGESSRFSVKLWSTTAKATNGGKIVWSCGSTGEPGLALELKIGSAKNLENGFLGDTKLLGCLLQDKFSDSYTRAEGPNGRVSWVLAPTKHGGAPLRQIVNLVIEGKDGSGTIVHADAIMKSNNK